MNEKSLRRGIRKLPWPRNLGVGLGLGLALLTSALQAAPPGQRAGKAPTGLPNYKTLCAQASPDAEYFIPEAFTSKVVTSKSADYAYRKGCPFWIVDFSMNSKSNSFIFEGRRLFDGTDFDGVSSDLPSTSGTAADMTPGTEQDCTRLRVEYFVYKKFKHEANFVFQAHSVRAAGMWGTSCVIPTPGQYLVSHAPTANVLVVRIATRVKLRNAYQEAAARAVDHPPQ